MLILNNARKFHLIKFPSSQQIHVLQFSHALNEQVGPFQSFLINHQRLQQRFSSMSFFFLLLEDTLHFGLVPGDPAGCR